MYWRPIREADLEACLAIQLACIGDGLVARGVALRVWRSWLASPAFLANVIKAERRTGGDEIVACGMGVFVDGYFVDRELANPAPGLNSRIVASVAHGSSVVLDREAIAAGNAADGLDFVNLYGSWRDDITDAAALAEIHGLLGTSFVEHFAGYRFKRVLKEAIGRPTIDLAKATGTYRFVAEFEESASALVMITPETARTAPYSLAARVYSYRAPQLRLKPAEQVLLAAALDGKTDAELSADLGVSIEAVKKRWLSIFERVEDAKPEILSSAAADGATRGPQKRHRVVAYVRKHPEELRPFRWEPDACVRPRAQR